MAASSQAKMATSSNEPSKPSRSTASSTSADQVSETRSEDRRQALHEPPDPEIAVETLVEYLLAAKRSLSSMQHVLRANDIATNAWKCHEEAAILGAQSDFLHQTISKQTMLLMRFRYRLRKTYDAGKREFGSLAGIMDATNEKLKETMGLLRQTPVEPAFRPSGEEPKNLLDFVDEKSVDDMVVALRKCQGELEEIQTSFGSDLARFDDDLRALKKSMMASQSASSPSNSATHKPIPHLLLSIVEHSHAMAQLLASLTKHFDLCVTAVRATEGGADLARRRAAEATMTQGGDQAGDPVSISGVIADQESQVSNLEPTTSQDRDDMISVVVGDAAEVDGVVREINERLRAVEHDFSLVQRQAEQARTTYGATVATFRVLEDVGGRIAGYLAAETEFQHRWEDEKFAIYGKLGEMDDLRDFYGKYAGAYDSLLLEVERRRLVEDRIQSLWRGTETSVDKLVDSDRREREDFRQRVGEYIPTDLWPGMDVGMKRWELVAVAEPENGGSNNNRGVEEGAGQDSTPALDASVVDAARDRRQRGTPL